MQQKILIAYAIFSTLSLSCIYGQSDSIVFRNHNSEYYAATDFNQVDSLDRWFYVLLDKDHSYEDSIKPIGQLIFQREKAISNWTPNFIFRIFDIKDSVYCFNKSNAVRLLSSCIPPHVGGDIIIIGRYIFLDTRICKHNKNTDIGRDYCRPVINKIFSFVDPGNSATLSEIVEQFPIKGQSIAISL